ncbi:MAG: UDP-3-O-(3-hydroxymyristoyl)glucosamine N-acyltransferase [SAR324 cluster bacterium]|nr:UDP-3-O-(3-hydroxymyristoyl)glucosamine N-acyltransferase [SAR324 cluster bacterium]
MPLTLEKLCQELNLSYSGNGELVIRQVCGLNKLMPGGVVFINVASDLAEIPSSSEIGVVVPVGTKSSDHNLIYAADPLALHVEITRYLHPSSEISKTIHPTAVIGKNVVLGKNVTLDAHVVLYDNVKVGANSILHAGVVVMHQCTIGENCLIYPNVTIREDCWVGDRVIIHSGSVIGSDGYGYFQRNKEHHKIPQIGNVILEDDVEIGGCCAIDRSRFYSTILGQGTKLDNLVHIAHNVEVGAHSLLTAQVGIAGSTKAGHHLVMGGQSGIVDQVEVGNEVTILSRGLISKNTKDHTVVGGAPARPAKKWKHLQALFNRLDTLFARVKRLEKLVERDSASD